MIVFDASAMVDLLLGGPEGAPVAERAAGENWSAPHLLDLEVAQVMRRHSSAGRLTAQRAAQVLTDLRDAPVERYPHGPLLPEIWRLRGRLTAYDAAYVVLARALNARLLTRDAALARAAAGETAIELC